jgi:hypothetical protein
MSAATSSPPRARWSCLAGAVLVALTGCGDDGMNRHRITGTVTYDGKPVESGAIFFEPTASVGMIAPTAYLRVENGKYDTGDKGPVAGKYRVVVGGMNQSKETVDSDGVTHTPRLFPDYKFEVDIPPPNDTLDVVVPVAAPKKK